MNAQKLSVALWRDDRSKAAHLAVLLGFLHYYFSSWLFQALADEAV